MRKSIVIVLVALAVGFAAGWLIGRRMLENSWRQPFVRILPAEPGQAAIADADPMPPVGTLVLRPMPLQRTRLSLKALDEVAKVRVMVGSIGRNDDGLELHLTLKNLGPCQIESVEGVAYGFDAWGEPASLRIVNLNGLL